MARPDTWMPMYWRDFWADTGHLSPVEGWAYMNLIGAYWTNGGPLANDDARLQRQAKVSASEWRKVRPAVIAFFSVDDKHIHHKRIDEELAIATKRHAAKVLAGANGAKKRWQKDSTAIAQPSASHEQTDAQLQPHSPIGETLANASVTARAPNPPKSAKGTRLANDWKPSESHRSYAREQGYTDAEADAEFLEIREYYTNPNCRYPVKKCWDSAIQRWLRENTSRRFAKRNRAGQPIGNRRGPGSVLAALGTVLDPGHGNPSGVGETVQTPPVFTGASTSASSASGAESAGDESGGGDVIDGEWERVPEAFGGDEIPHAAEGGSDRGHSGADRDLCEAPGSIPGGYRAVCAEDTDGREPMVAGVERTEGASGSVDVEPQAQTSGADHEPDVGPMPEFMNRHA
jgi:uncharacterized protein YdaU (DUF1376 family)